MRWKYTSSFSPSIHQKKKKKKRKNTISKYKVLLCGSIAGKTICKKSLTSTERPLKWCMILRAAIWPGTLSRACPHPKKKAITSNQNQNWIWNQRQGTTLLIFLSGIQWLSGEPRNLKLWAVYKILLSCYFQAVFLTKSQTTTFNLVYGSTAFFRKLHMND